MSGTPITLKQLKRIIAKKQKLIVDIERAIASKTIERNNTMDEDEQTKLSDIINYNRMIIERLIRDKVLLKNEYNSIILKKKGEYYTRKHSVKPKLTTILNSNNATEEEEEEEIEGGKRHVRRRTTVRRIKKLRRTRRGSKRTYK